MKIIEHRKVIALRKLGYSVKEIAALVPVSKSTVSIWVQGVKLSRKAEARIAKRVGAARLRAGLTKRTQVKNFETKCLREGLVLASDILGNASFGKVICAMLYWCEGNKNA